ncbi:MULTISPECIES: anti-adapter protein SpxO [Bacillus]|uniref:PepSY domain-containing protein n=1 Tax=Bacillus xiamenensis TaxID=1178537 RepID=A0ABT4EXH8_9BACI|nr:MULTISPECIES: anti-adapter protein SpxO [Bacillus]EKF36370.1 hypothetical protein BA1_05897 [Bacillus xiamenensis]MCW1835302.1 PepSY domain-containing protein [Bacillus xiamenensis]MCY9574514.1 PepSY domain-containing protein [Bacillus xiamenensis]
MREIDDMIRRLKAKGIQVEKVKMPKETTIEKKWMYQAGKKIKATYRDFTGYSFI